MYKIDFMAIAKMIGKFVTRNEGAILGITSALGLGLLAKKLDVPIDVRIDRDTGAPVVKTHSYSNIYQMPTRPYFGGSPKEMAITTLLKNAEDSYSSNTKVACAKRIRDIIKDSKYEPDDAILAYAINCLEKISNDCYSSEIKGKIGDLIIELAKEA